VAQPESLGDILARKLKSLGVAKKLKEASVSDVWSEVVGEAIAAHTEPIRCENGKLLVKVDNPVWRHELIYQKPNFLRKLNGKLGEHVVDDIYFTGP
jgi:predicted nucleic acid-binding Zn ribbon protein